jgi:mRNA interferase MazF
MDEARGNLDGCRRQGSRRQAAPCVIVQDDAFDGTDFHHGLCLHDRPDGGAAVPLAGRAKRIEWPERRVSRDGRQDDDGAESKVGSRIGRLEDEDVLRMNRAILVFLGLATSSRPGREPA